MNWMTSLAEEKIREAIVRGEMNDLPGKGKPLPPEDDLATVPEELRMGYRMLRNAGMLPEEMQLRKDMVTLEDLLLVCRDEAEVARLGADLRAKKLRYRLLMEERGWSSNAAFAEYERQINAKMSE